MIEKAMLRRKRSILSYTGGTMNYVCFAAGILCLAYYFVIVIYAGITADFAWIWLLAAVVLAGLGGAVFYGKHHPGFWPGWLKILLTAVLAAGVLLFFSICTQVIKGMYAKGSEKLDYVIVLGAQVKGSRPSRALKKRLDKALSYGEKNKNTILILSGGKGQGEDITEAECMKNYLTDHEIPESRLILEEKSTTTKENLVFSDQLTDCGKKRTGILSNNFHVYRACKLAEKQGYRYAEGVAAPSDPVMQVHYVVREVFALVKEKAVGNI